jgi:hypothetical protein
MANTCGIFKGIGIGLPHAVTKNDLNCLELGNQYLFKEMRMFCSIIRIQNIEIL